MATKDIIERWKQVHPFFTERLKIFVKNNDRGGEDFSDLMGVSKSTLGKLLKGNYPSPLFLNTIKRIWKSDLSCDERTMNGVKSSFGQKDLDFLELETLIDFVNGESNMPPSYVDVEVPAGVSKPTNSTATGISVPDLEAFEKVCRISFELCVRRKQNPNENSESCMMIFGLTFDPKCPVLQLEAVIQAISTELEHLKDVSFHENRERIAEEVLDIFRCLFLLTIVGGIENFDRIKWIDIFSSPYKSTDGDGKHEMRELPNLLHELRASVLDAHILPLESLLKWLEKTTAALGRFSKDRGLSIGFLSKELHKRLHERESGKNYYIQHARHKQIFKPYVVLITCIACFPDERGAYVELLEQIAEQGFSILASTSTTVSWNETAKARFLLAIGFAKRMDDHLVDSKIHAVKTFPWQKAPDVRRPLLLSFIEIARRPIIVGTEIEYLKAARTSIIEFRENSDFDHVGAVLNKQIDQGTKN